MSRNDNILSEEEIMQQARDTMPNLPIEINSVLDACEHFYGNGFPDQVGGDVEAPTGHFYRVHRWLVITDSYGFQELETYDNEAEAQHAFDVALAAYIEWEGEDDE